MAPDWTNHPEDPERHLIVLSAPRLHHPKYKWHFEPLIDFDVRLAQAIIGHDNVIVLASRDEMPFLRGRLPDDVLLEANVRDIWIRDFAPILTTKMVQFVYRPSYLSWGEAAEASDSFASFCRRYGLQFERSRLVLDGGNLVTNYKGMAVVTERVFSDNPGWTRDEIVSELKGRLELEHVAIIPEEPGDATGHADGMVAWVSEKILAVTGYPPPLGERILAELRRQLPDTTVTPLPPPPSAPRPRRKRRIGSAFGLSVNSIATTRNVYAPAFEAQSDRAFLDAAEAHSNQAVWSIRAIDICHLGGSARCLSWQVTGDSARLLVRAATGDQ